MSVAALSRIQFATVAVFHFLFVPLTLGLTVMTACMETRYARTGDETFLKMTRYWSRLMLVNFAVGVVTGITLEFQFGMNWAEYSKFVGDIFGAPLAIEATVAFFLESTFIGVWMFSWKRVSRGVHAGIMWVVAGASTLSALWILLANGWMQRPRGYELVGGRAVLTSFGALLGSPYVWIKFFHVIASAYTLTAFFIMGISAIQILLKKKEEMFRRSFRIAATFGIVTSIMIIVAGDLSGVQVAKYQPSKLAAMEAQWETEKGADFYILQLPRPEKEENSIEALEIPGGLSFLAYHDANAVVKGLKDFPPSDRPPVLVTFVAFRLMVALGFLFVLLALVSVILAWRKKLSSHRWFLWIMSFAIILPYLASELGWVVAEIGRQPWIVYGLLRTQEAVSRNLTPGDVLGSLIAFIAIYVSLAVVDVFLLKKYANKVED
ncbi:MAG: cytochrome ubiquinol oxidase subunit I [Spirochaetia bacterium]